MSHHKRRRPKHQRAGCLFCKGHKDERMPGDGSSKTGGLNAGRRGLRRETVEQAQAEAAP